MKWLQVWLFITNNFTEHYSFFWIQSNCPEHCYKIPIIQFRHSVKEYQVLLFNTCNSIPHYSFVCTLLNSIKYWYGSQTIQSFLYTQLNNQILLFLTIQFSINRMFALGLNIKVFCLTHRWNSISCYHFGTE